MSTLPIEIGTGWIHGRFIVAVTDGSDTDREPDAIPAQGSVRFNASIGYNLAPSVTGGPVTIINGPIVGIFDDEGYLCTPNPFTGDPMYRGVKLTATDDPDLAVVDWTWTATYQFGAAGGITPSVPAHSFAVPTDSTQDLATLASVPSSPGYGLPQAEAAVLRAESAAVSAEQSAADALAAALRAEAVAGATDAGVASLLVDPGTESGGVLSDKLASKADIDAMNNALATKVETSDLTSGLAGKADLVGGKVPVSQLPTDALVTDANVAAVVNGAQTGTAIDERITTQATPLVEPIVADYIASSQVVVDAAAAAVDANPKIATLEQKNTEQDTAIESKRITHIATAKPVTDVASTYPLGVSYFGTSETGWPTRYGTVLTVRWAAGRTAQTYSTSNGKTYTRRENGSDIWTEFTENSIVGHTHDRIRLVGAEARLDSIGQFQYLNPDAELVWQVKTDGVLSHGNVPWARLTGIPTDLIPVKCVRLEAGKWVWDTVAGTHYVIPDHTGALIVRATAVPVPAATPALNW